MLSRPNRAIANMRNGLVARSCAARTDDINNAGPTMRASYTFLKSVFHSAMSQLWTCAKDPLCVGVLANRRTDGFPSIIPSEVSWTHLIRATFAFS